MALVDYSELKELNLWQLFDHSSTKFAEREALVSGSRRLTFGQLRQQIEQCAAGLYKHGIRKGDRIGLIMPNWAEFPITYWAAARLGAVLVPLNVRYRAQEIEYMLHNSEAKIVVTCANFGGFDFIHLLNEMRPRLPDLQTVVVVGQAQGGHGLVSWENLLHQAAPATLPALELDPQADLFTIIYTSGTTGVPKGAMLTHANLVTNGLMMAEVMEITEQDRFLVCVPFFHIFGMSPCMVSSYGSGAAMVLLDIFKADDALRLVETEQITVHHGVPTMFILELNHPNFSSFNLSSLRTGIIAAAPAPAEVIRRIRREMGCEIASAYGLTETSPCLTMTTFDDDDTVRAETVGRALPGVDIRIVDDTDTDVPTGEIGELICRSNGVMQGYYKMPDATDAALRNGWFHTGDLATLDERGYVRIVGRKKEMIIRGGFKVYPREIEELYYHHPAVQEVAVVGLPDPVLGERTLVCIKLKEGQSAETQEMLDFIHGKLADFKRPDYIRFVDAFPMTGSGKIKKVELRDQIAANLGNE
jgi:fatty-acyl-CoA synthase